MERLERMRLYCFSPGDFLRGRDAETLVRAQIRGGADVIQLREKRAAKRAKLEMGRMLRRVTRETGTLFIVNDDLDLAMILDADGLHVGQEDLPIEVARPYLPGKIVGVSTHSMEQARAAIEAGADYLGVGPVFPTSTKENPDPLVGVDLVRRVTELSPVPVVAIGGIGLDNVDRVLAAGGRCMAVVSDILNADDVEARTRALKSRIAARTG